MCVCLCVCLSLSVWLCSVCWLAVYHCRFHFLCEFINKNKDDCCHSKTRSKHMKLKQERRKKAYLMGPDLCFVVLNKHSF